MMTMETDHYISVIELISGQEITSANLQMASPD